MLKSRYDVVILGAGHNALVAAGYLARAGLSVLVLEKNDTLGGASTSRRIFPDYDATLSRYAYLVALLSPKIIGDLGLNIELRRRPVGAFTPYVRKGRHEGLLSSNVSETATRESLFNLTDSHIEFERLTEFYALVRLFADRVWDTMLEPLRSRAALQKLFTGDARLEESWRMLVEEPLGIAVERHITNDLLRGVVFTDAKIGVFTHPHDDSLLQNRCFLYHLIGNRVGEWKVPVGGMQRLVGELERVARRHGAQFVTSVNIEGLDVQSAVKSVRFQRNGKSETVEGRWLLANFGRNVLARILNQPYEPDRTHEGSVFKINMLLRRLPKLKAAQHTSADAFTGTFHMDEGYEAMKMSWREAGQGALPERIPAELYCHTLTDDSILAEDLRKQGFHTLTLFALDTPWRLFASDNAAVKRRAEAKLLKALNEWLADPIEDCLARARDGSPCIESKSPVDIEGDLGHYRGNIFHSALTFPFVENESEVGTWGVETEWPNVLLCGSSARRGGAVSGIPGHNAAMKVLEVEKSG
jgi:phytoene dehydrogenase-like protein